MNVAFIYNDIYRNSLFGENHPITEKRISNVYDLSKIISFNNVKYYKSSIASVKQLSIFHDKDYILLYIRLKKNKKFL